MICELVGDPKENLQDLGACSEIFWLLTDFFQAPHLVIWTPYGVLTQHLISWRLDYKQKMNSLDDVFYAQLYGGLSEEMGNPWLCAYVHSDGVPEDTEIHQMYVPPWSWMTVCSFFTLALQFTLERAFQFAKCFIPLIPHNPQDSPTGKQWPLQSYKRRNKGRRSFVTPQGHVSHMARPANKSNANRCYVCYMCDTLLCVIYEGTHFCPQKRDLLRDATSSHLTRGN